MDALAVFGEALRRNINQATEAGDEDAADLFTEVSRSIDKHLWFAEAHAQANAESIDYWARRSYRHREDILWWRSNFA